MTNNITSIWVTILLIVTTFAYKVEGDHRQTAHRLDLKIMTLEITRNPETIPRMNRLRNEERKSAEQWESVYMSLSIAAGIAAVAMAVSGMANILLMSISVGFAAVGLAAVVLKTLLIYNLD